MDRLTKTVREIGNKSRFAQNGVFRVEAPGKHLPPFCQIKSDGITGIVIDPQKILCSRSLGYLLLLDDRPELPIHQRTWEEIVEQLAVNRSQPMIKGHPRGRFEPPIVNGRPYLRIWLQVVDNGISTRMGAHHVVQDFQGCLEVFFPGRKHAIQIGTDREHIGLVYRHPQVAVGHEGFDRFSYEIPKQINDPFVFPSTQFRHPKGLTEVVQGDHWRDLAVMQPDQHFAVAIQRILIPSVRCRLDTAPGDR